MTPLFACILFVGGMVLGFLITCEIFAAAVRNCTLVFKHRGKWTGETDAFVDIFLTILKGKELVERDK